MMTTATTGSATLADLRAIPEDQRYHEVVHGEVLRKRTPSGPHGRAQLRVGVFVEPFHRRAGGSAPGGWWFASETEVELSAHEVFRPDVSGWRRERLPELPKSWPISVRADWVCEVVSPSRPQLDRVEKLQVYHQHGVPHYWLVDPEFETLTVHRWTPDGYLVVLAARRGDRVRPEPFGALELQVGTLFGDDPDESSPTGTG